MENIINNLWVSNKYSEELCEKHLNTLFVFGENQVQQGLGVKGGGQAVIRPCINSFGFCTLAEIGKYWKDEEYSENIVQIETDIISIKKSEYENICFPMYGLGTGRAKMLSNCPKTFLYMSKRLLTEFKFNNVEYLLPPNF